MYPPYHRNLSIAIINLIFVFKKISKKHAYFEKHYVDNVLSDRKVIKVTRNQNVAFSFLQNEKNTRVFLFN